MQQLSLLLPDQLPVENVHCAPVLPVSSVIETPAICAPPGSTSEIADDAAFALDNLDSTLPPHTWGNAPNVAFEDWQRHTTSSEGLRYAEKSIEQHCAMFRRFADYLVARGFVMLTISAPEIALFLEALTAKDGMPAVDATKQRYLKLLRATFEHLRKIRYRTTPNPCGLLSRFNRRELDAAPTSLATSENDVFVNLVLQKEPQNWMQCRDQAMLLLIIASGLKASEIIHLKTMDLMLDESPPFIQIAAHGKVPERVTPISEFALLPLRQWLAVRAQMSLVDGDDTVFVSSQGGAMRPETLHRKCKAILGTNKDVLRPHGGYGPQVLRNGFLLRQLNNGKPLAVVQQWAGHVEAKSTARFLRLVVNPDGVEVS